MFPSISVLFCTLRLRGVRTQICPLFFDRWVKLPVMGGAKTDDLCPDPQTPEGTRIINERCLIRTQDEHRVMLVSGIVLAQYSLTDQIAKAYARVILVEQGWATQQDVARVSHCSARTVRRNHRRFENSSLSALGQLGGDPKGQ